MGLKSEVLRIKDILSDQYIRLDTKYRIFSDKKKFNIWNIENTKPLSYCIQPIVSNILKKGELEEEYFLVDLKSIERKTNTLIDIELVNEIGSDKVILEKGDLIIPKMEPKKGQLFLNLNHQKYLGSTELIEYKINLEIANPKFLYYVLVNNKTLEAMSYLESGKTHRRVQSFDLLKIQIPNVPLNIQNQVVTKIEPIEQEIQTLKAHKKDPLKIMNEIFANEFKIDLQKVFELDSIKSFSLKLQNVDSRNDLLRTSYKWHKLKTIQSFMYEKIDCIKKLGKFITQTKNGWSPESSEIEEGTPVLGQEHILKKGIIDINPTKYTILTKSNIQDFFINQNDFFVSRGNTVELVALAGVVMEDIEQDIIYPDLYIKIDFEDEFVDKQYMAFLFNSFIGRIYFKHVAKGKNQTMVKVSSKELLEFYLPLPDLKKQQQIVEKIKSQINAQKLIDMQIEQKQKEISDLIYQCIKG